MRLLLDIGNTSIQWLQVNEDNLADTDIKVQRHNFLWGLVFSDIVETLQGKVVQDVFVASVLSEEENEKIGQQLRLTFNARATFYKTESSRLGLNNSYKDAAKLGVDRWLAILEAWHRHGASVVIDCGSAITIDVASSSGKHHGGYIVPGYTMLVKALYQGTAQVKVEPEWPIELSFGVNTSQAVNKGCAQMCVSFINDVLKDVERQFGTVAVYLTGGDAVNLVGFLPQNILLDNALVLYGLNRVAVDILRGR